MKINIQQAEKLLKSSQSFSQLGLSMLVTRLRTTYAKDSSQAMLQKSTDEINAFLDKFSSILGADYAVITKIT